jgi:hypothetical protein
MAGRILLVNPIGHKRKRKKVSSTKGAPKMAAHRKRRTAAQKAATARMVAANRARRKNPIRSKKRRSLRSVAHSAVAHVRRRRRHNPIGKTTHHRRRRRNPIGGLSGGIVNRMLMPAVTAAGGALALDLAWGYLPIPANLKVGSLQYVAKAAGAVAIGTLGAKVMKRHTAEAMAVGALTVVFHTAARDLISKMLPSVHLGYVNAGYPAGFYESDSVQGIGEYVGEYVAGHEGYVGEYVQGVDGYAGAGSDAYSNYY